MPYDIVILHGTMGSPDINWFPWMKTECEKLGHTVYIPRFPTPKNQNPNDWCAVLRKEAPIFGENTIIIGHSIGATFLLTILDTIQNPIHTSIFVAPVMGKIGNTEYDRLNDPFLKNFDWKKIRKNAGAIHIFHGDDDPYVPLSHPQLLQENISGKLKIIQNGGHLNGESGYTAFPELINIF